jgi:hypothetical protein
MISKRYLARAAYGNARYALAAIQLGYDRVASSNLRLTSSQFTTFQKAST